MQQLARSLVCVAMLISGCGGAGQIARDAGSSGVGGVGGSGGSGSGGSGGSGGTSGSGGTGGVGGSGGTSGSGGTGGSNLVDGWTAFDMQPSALVIHVSNSGDDNNPGTIDLPKATLRGGYEAVRDGEADWVLLARGSQWTASSEFIWGKSGPAADDAGWMRIGAYGDESLPRPRINSGVATALVLTPGYQATRPLTHIAVTDVHLVAQGRIDVPASAPDEVMGVQVLAVEYQGSGDAIRGVLLENLKLEGFSEGVITYADTRDLAIRRCIFTEIFVPGGDGSRSTGILANGDGLLFEENVFYRIQHPDMAGVTAISTQSHSAYLGAEGRNVVSRGNIILKTTEGFMQRAGGVYERNVSAFNEIAHLSGQAWGVTPTAGGITATVHDNLMLNANGSMILGNTATGTILRNVIVRGPEGATSIGIDLIEENAQGSGTNIGVHDTQFADNRLSGNITYNMSDTTSFSGLTFTNNQTALGALQTTFASFLTSVGLSGDVDDYGRDLIARDRSNFRAHHRAESMINHYREPLGLPLLP